MPAPSSDMTDDLMASTTQTPAHFGELQAYIESHLEDPQALLVGLVALLVDSRSYTSRKSQPTSALADLAHKLTLSDPAVRQVLGDDVTLFDRQLLNGHWRPVWKTATPEEAWGPSHRYDVCISFAGGDRDVARRIADRISSRHDRKVFYDEFAAVDLWGENLFTYLHDIYSAQSRFCIILFSRAYLERAWTRHELRAAQTRVLEERASYVLPVALEANSIPQEFSTTSYWPFADGDEDAIADAAEKKINGFIGEHFISLDDMTDAINRDRVAAAIVMGFDTSIAEHRHADDAQGAVVMTALAAIAATDSEKLIPDVRAIIDLVLFSPGSVAGAFDDEHRVVVFGDASVRRWLGSNGPLLLSSSGWEEHITDLLSDDHDEEDDEVVGSEGP
jgi:hypothetical protein